MSVMGLATSFAAGMAGWSVTEYVLHRGFGHDPRSTMQFSREHMKHHQNPDYFAPAAEKVKYVGKLVLVSLPVLILAIGGGSAVAFVVGYVAFYSFYEFVHRRIHTHPPTGAYSRFVRLHHLHHHFHEPSVNHGVSTPIWDFVFGTYVPVRQVQVPAKLAMRWLCDPETGEVREPFREDYLLKRGKQAQTAESSLSGTVSIARVPLQEETGSIQAEPENLRQESM